MSNNKNMVRLRQQHRNYEFTPILLSSTKPHLPPKCVPPTIKNDTLVKSGGASNSFSGKIMTTNHTSSCIAKCFHGTTNSFTDNTLLSGSSSSTSAQG